MPEQMSEYRGEPMESQLVENIMQKPEFKARLDLIIEANLPESEKAELFAIVKSLAGVYQGAEKRN